MSDHKFNVEHAKEYGIEKAILLEHLIFHQKANEGNEELEIDGETYAFIKPATIKKMYPYLNYSSVRRWLKELEEDGIIKSKKPHKSSGNHLKYYRVVITNGQNDQSNDQTDQSKNGQNDHSSIITNVNTNNERVEEIYQLYPRHVGKKKALQKIGKAIKEFGYEELKDKVELYAKAVKDKDRQYIPYPATWFNQGRYMDDPEEWQAFKDEGKQHGNSNNDPRYKVLN